MQLRIIEIICGMLEQIPLQITIGRISIHVGGILSEIISLIPDVMLIILIIYLIKSKRRMEKRQEEIIKMLKNKDKVLTKSLQRDII